MGDGKHLRQYLNRKPHTMHDANSPVEPCSMLSYVDIPVTAIQSQYRHIDPYAPVQNLVIAHLTLSALVH